MVRALTQAERDYDDQRQWAYANMSDDLVHWCDLVWTHRNKANDPNLDLAYSLYNKSAKSPNFDINQVRTFLAELRRFIPLEPEIQCTLNNADELGLMLRGFYRARQPPYGFPCLPTDAWDALVEDAQQYPFVAKLLSETFYHFRNPGTVPATRRIYINVPWHHRVRVMTFLVREVLPLQGVSNIKVAPPAAQDRVDSILVYLSDEAAEVRALECIRAYQRGGRAYFNDGVPRSTKMDSELRGVSTAAEPTFDLDAQDGVLIQRNAIASYGSVRAMILNHALRLVLRQPPPLRTKDIFMQAVVGHFRTFFLDPKQPWRDQQPPWMAPTRPRR